MLTRGNQTLCHALTAVLAALPLCGAPRAQPSPRPYAALAPFRGISWQPAQGEPGPLWDAAQLYRAPEDLPATLRLVPVTPPGHAPAGRAPAPRGSGFPPSCRF